MIRDDAFFDESFSSWAFRLALWCEEFCVSPDVVNNLYYQSISSSLLDPDYNSNSLFVKALGLHLQTLWPDKSFQHLLLLESRLVMPRYYRRSFCYDCLCDQIKTSWSPAILKRWGVVYYCVCDVHQATLTDADYHDVKKANAAHDFFCFHAERRNGSLKETYSLAANQAALRVQSFLMELDWHEQGNATDRTLFDFCCLFLEVMLFPRHGVCNVSRSRKELSAQSSVWQQSYLGPYLATVLERQSAVLLLGWVLGICDGALDFLPDCIGSKVSKDFKNFWGVGVLSSYLPERLSMYYALRLHFLAQNISASGVTEYVSGFRSRFV
ncbi:hypothetical protein EBI_27580 [Enterocytozoon bieneusi H348]|nr:hypothetical protein EBI_27580 [Enterocytozoon bieneusi H348]|eukprot:XP_002650881.1 hypothetical protein EBI_27580 [Enterocytozoon bieneusi H348]